jgi:hypothetical protein
VPFSVRISGAHTAQTKRVRRAYTRTWRLPCHHVAARDAAGAGLIALSWPIMNLIYYALPGKR